MRNRIWPVPPGTRRISRLAMIAGVHRTWSELLPQPRMISTVQKTLERTALLSADSQ